MLKNGIDPDFFDFTYTPIIQSSNYQFKLNIENSEEELGDKCILLSVSCKYFDLMTNCYRTMLINPDDKTKSNYRALLSLHQNILGELQPGEIIQSVIHKAVNEFKKKHPDLANKLPDKFGYGIGFEFWEKSLTLSEKTQLEIKENNVFNVVTSLKNLEDGLAMLLSDTVVIKAGGNVKLTD